MWYPWGLTYQPVSIGDVVSFTARLVHVTQHTCRVFVTVQVLDPTDPLRLPERSNRLVFLFAVAEPPTHCRQDGSGDDGCFILPQSYPEVLMQVEAQRRHDVEGPTDDEAYRILQQARQKHTSTKRT